jgi:hypothetical protein
MSQNAERLSELGVLYPELARTGHAHHKLASQLQNNVFEGLKSIVDLQKQAPDYTVVASSEELGLLTRAQIAALRDIIEPFPARIVMYVRPLTGWFPSKYNEYTKKGANLVDFDRFYASHDISKGLRIVAIAQNWAKVFGWENLRIRSLDSRSLSGTLIDDFLSVFRLSLSAFGGPQANGLESKNPSFGWKTLEVLRAQFAAVAPHSRYYETRKGHPRISLSVASSLRKPVVKVLTEAGLDAERTQYMGAQQWAECEAAFCREVELLNDCVVGPRLPTPDPVKITERPFLPSVEQIPLTERQEIYQRLHDVFVWREPHWARFAERRLAQVGVDSNMWRCIIDTLVTAQ